MRRLRRKIVQFSDRARILEALDDSGVRFGRQFERQRNALAANALEWMRVYSPAAVGFGWESQQFPRPFADKAAGRLAWRPDRGDGGRATRIDRLPEDEPMLQRFKISAEKMFWVLAAGAVAIPVLVIFYETNFGSAAGQ